MNCPYIFLLYREVSKFSDAKNLCCNLPKIQTKRPNLRVFHQKDANGKQTVKTLIRLLLSVLFAQTCLSENLGSLR